METNITDTARTRDEFNAQVKQGREGWNYIYITLAFTLTFVGTVIQMVPISFPYNLIFYALAFAGTCCLFLLSGRFQRWLIGLKISYEEKFR
jgi:archaellum biogenesis protein FlaJ (TadC family)